MRFLGFLFKTIFIAAAPVVLYLGWYVVAQLLFDFGGCSGNAGFGYSCELDDGYSTPLVLFGFSVFVVPGLLFLWVDIVLLAALAIGIWKLIRRKKPQDADA